MSNINYQPYLYNKPKPHKRSSQHRSLGSSVIVAIVFVLSLGVCLYSIYSPSHTTPSALITYYAVCQGEYDTLVEARSHVNELQNRNGAGYVMSNDENYTLVCAIYNDRDSASSVVGRNTNTFVKEIAIYTPTIENIDTDIIERIYSTLDALYQDLYTLSNDIDSDTVSPNDARATISRLISTIDEYKTTNIDNVYLNTLLECVRFHLNSLLNEGLTSSGVRYCYCATVNALLI